MSSHAKSLANIIENHTGKVLDKWSIYLTEYDRLFFAFRDRHIRLLEIGIQNGGSLEIWSQFFSNAEKIVGCDINPACAGLVFENQKIAMVVANANTDEAERQIQAHSPKFDLVIDDGSHQSGDIVRSFARYFAHLNDGGLYVVEDMHCSYWQEFEGGLFNPYSSISFFKRIADTINHEHWGIDKTCTELLRSLSRKYNTTLNELILAHIHSIEFINSMCVIRKRQPTDNILGIRRVAGTIALVDEASRELHGRSISRTDQSANPWSERDVPAEAELVVRIREIDNLNQDIDERDKKIIFLNQTLAERDSSYAQKLLQTQQSYQQEMNDQRRQQAEREEAHHAQHKQLREQIEAHLLALAGSARTYAQQILQVQQSRQQELNEQHRQHDLREQSLNTDLYAKQDEIQSLTNRWVESEKAQAIALSQLNKELNDIRATRTWRWSAPLRRLAKLLKHQ